MNPLQKLRYKTRIGCLLGALLLLLVVNNIMGQESFARMRRDATSIYEDRLMPSTFLFNIREDLYEERRLLSSGGDLAVLAAQLHAHRDAVAQLMARYERTRLTAEERREWALLKAGIHASHHTTASGDGLDQTMQALGRLLAIQAAEGAQLEQDMSDVLSRSSLRAYVEIVLLIVIGSITLSLIGWSRNVFEQVPQRPFLN